MRIEVWTVQACDIEEANFTGNSSNQNVFFVRYVTTLRVPSITNKALIDAFIFIFYIENAPVSLTLSLITAIAAMLYSGHPGRYALDLDKILSGQLSRILSSFFVFSSPSQAFLATLMLYSYRLFERQLGSSKYAAFFAVSLVCSLLLKLAVMILGNFVGLRLVPAAGPFFFLFAQLPFYYRKYSYYQYFEC